MKHLPLYAAIIIALSACGESGKSPGKVSTPAPIAPPTHVFVKATTDIPAATLSMQAPAEPCNIDAINGKAAEISTTVADKAKTTLSGWAGNVATGVSPQEVFVEIEGPGKYYIKADHGIKRPDVAAYFKKPGLEDSGWEAYADLSGVAAGVYKVLIIQVTGQSGMVCEAKNSISIN